MKFLLFLAKIPQWLWKSLEQKGKYTSLIGIAIVISAVTKPLIDHNHGVIFEQDYMFQIIYFVLGGIILIILPSYIKVSKVGLEVKD